MSRRETETSEMLNGSEAEQIAHTEALFREVNERIAETAERLDATETRFVCECGDPRCAHRVEATLEQYERVRSDARRFLLAPAHEDVRVEAVVRERSGHTVVEKRHPRAVSIVRRRDPRAA